MSILCALTDGTSWLQICEERDKIKAEVARGEREESWLGRVGRLPKTYEAAIHIFSPYCGAVLPPPA